MMISQPLFIPLYFDEAETDLWLALQRVEPEKRSSFIKETLRQALLGFDSEIPESNNKVNDHYVVAQANEVLKNEVQVEPIQEIEPVRELERIEPIESFSLDDLFAQATPNLGEGTVISKNLEFDEVKLIPGFEYMMKHIIGTEEDETVLMVLNQSTESKGQKPK